ncbi:MAG TPA: BACON domain-containing protein [Vicinamibacterales bacterium]|nr:BACON domain-containing protein [Vicinamibacterales bacterium]
MIRHQRLLLAVVASAGAALAAAACSKSDSSPSGSCSVTLGTVTTSVAASATTGTIPVTAASSCAWTATSSATFVSITSGGSGTGNGTVNYSIAANTGAARSGSITVNGTAVNFSQSAANLIAPAQCAVTVSPTSVKINSGGGSADITVATVSNCSWTATSNASFITTSASGAGSGTAKITATTNLGASRSGTVTIGGQTVTVTQDPGVFAAFNLFDPAQSTNATNVCAFRSATGGSTTCTLRSTSFTQGTAGVVSFEWTVQYTYGTAKVITQSGDSSSVSFTDQCGVANGGATDDGALQPLDVTLTVTDAFGNTSTAKAGEGNQPKMFVQLWNCDK